MKRLAGILLACASAVCFAALPQTGTDAARLLPAQTLVITQERGSITVESDTGAEGSGRTLDAALAQMARSAGGTLFLDTAEYIVLTRQAWALLPEVLQQPQLRPAAKPVLYTGASLPAAQADTFLQAHPTETTLCQLLAGRLRGEQPLPAILNSTENGGLQFAE